MRQTVLDTDPDLDALCEREIVDAGVAPGASVAVGRRDPAGWELLLGAAGRLGSESGATVSSATPFDLASVTKPFLAVTLARLAHAGELELESPLGRFLPELRHTHAGGASLEQLLAHRAGLEPHRPLFAPLLAQKPFDRAGALGEAARARRADAVGSPPEGHAPLYSDLGYLLAGEALSRAMGSSVEEVLRAQVCGPLGLDVAAAKDWLRRDPSFMATVAHTENVAWRGGVIRGVVHDENAWALGGHGCSGHAGLFGTAAAVARFGCALLDALVGASDWLAESAIARLVRPRPGGSLRAGFDGRSGELSAAGSRLGERTFGHLGFTGTSLWCDPDSSLVTVILTNRVSPTRDHLAIRQARPRVQDRLVERAQAL